MFKRERVVQRGRRKSDRQRKREIQINGVRREKRDKKEKDKCGTPPHAA